jgi:hypothetical protein
MEGKAELIGTEPGNCGCRKRKAFSDCYCVLKEINHHLRVKR